MIDYESELKRIRGILDSMTSKEFDNMLEECGINEIKPSCESDFVCCILDSSAMRGEYIMLEVLQYIFSSTDVFFMTIVLAYMIGHSISMVVRAVKE